MFWLSPKILVKTALLLSICGVSLQAQVTFHGLSLYAPISEVESLVDDLKLKNPGTIQQFYVAHRNGLKFNLEFNRHATGEWLLASIRTTSSGTYTDYLARAAAYQQFYHKPPSKTVKPTGVLNMYGSTWSFYPPLATLFNLIYAPETGIIGEMLHIDQYSLMQNQN